MRMTRRVNMGVMYNDRDEGKLDTSRCPMLGLNMLINFVKRNGAGCRFFLSGENHPLGL